MHSAKVPRMNLRLAKRSEPCSSSNSRSNSFNSSGSSHHTNSRKRKRVALSNSTQHNSGDALAERHVDKDGTTSLHHKDQMVPSGEPEQAQKDLELFSTPTKKSKTCSKREMEPGGLFHCLPTELFHLILSHLGPTDIASLSLTSSQLNSSIRDYVFTAAGSKHILPATPPPPMVRSGHVLSAMPFAEERENKSPGEIRNTLNEFESLGLLTKQLTMLQPIRSRLKVASFILNKLESTHQSLISLAGHSSAYFCFGRLLFAFVHGWDDHNKIKAFNLIQTIAKLEPRMRKVLHCEPSSQPLLERDIRLIHRRVFLDHAAKLGEREYGFWLTLILKQWPITFQARLLYLLTAPENEDGFVSWTLVCGCSNIQHFMMSVNFSELANSLRVLLELYPAQWSLDHIISIVDELTTTPNGWCLENVSQLLVHCGREISKGVLGCRAGNGRVEELVVICFYMANACLMKDGFDNGSEDNIRWFLEIFRNTLSTLPASTDKAAFVYSLVEKWQDYLTALFEDSMPEYYENELVQTEFLNTLGNFTKLCSVLLQLAMPS